MLSLPSAHRWDRSFMGDGFLINNRKIYLKEGKQRDEQIDGDTGFDIWDGSIILSKFIESQWNHFCYDLHPPNVLELGSGMGLCSLAVAAMGAKVIIASDMPYCLEDLKRNINENIKAWEEQDTNEYKRLSMKSDGTTVINRVDQQKFTVMALDWNNAVESKEIRDVLKTVDLIIGADIVWLDKLVTPLVKTVEMIFQCQQEYRLGDNIQDSQFRDQDERSKQPLRNRELQMLLQHTSRCRLVDRQFRNALEVRGFDIEEQEFLDPIFGTKKEEIFIFRIRKFFCSSEN